MVHDFQPNGQLNSAALLLQCPDSVGARLVGLAYVCALLGNVWAVINPWDNLFRAALIYSVIQRAVVRSGRASNSWMLARAAAGA